jgi:serine/threonine-protein kinase
MAPEQVRNQKADGRGDIYAFGVMFYELITGKHIFLVEGENVPMEQIMIGHLHADPPRPVHEIVPDCPETLWPILEHCLEKDPGQRYATMDEVADDLRAILRASLPPEHPLARRILQEKLRVERRAAFDTLAPEAPEDVAPAPAEAGTTTAGHRVTEPLIGFVPSASVLPFSSPRGPLPPPRPPPRGKGFTEEMPRLAPSAVHAARAVRPLAATPPVQTTPLVHIKTAAPARSSSPARSSTPSQPTGAGRSRSTLPLSYFLAPLAGLLLTLSGTIVVATIRSDRSAISPAQPGALPPSGAGTTGDPSPSATVTSPPIASVSAPVPDPISVVPTSIPAPPGATVVPAPPTASAAPKPPKPTSKPVAPAPKPTAPVPLFEFGGDTGSKTTPGKRK